ncbi:kanadaptin [Aplochiton taeniatus]
MATVLSPQGCEHNSDKEMDTVTEAVDCHPGSYIASEKKDSTNNDEETEDPFKKPALFAAPSLAGKRFVVESKTNLKSHESSIGKEQHSAISDNVVVHSDEYTAKSNDDDLDNENDTPKVVSDDEKSSNKEKTVPPVKTQDSKPRLPFKGPLPAGKFKPHPPLPYTEPLWGGVADIPYALEILKDGSILDSIPLTQNSYFVVGRLPVCDLSLEHPSISRYHAVLQYRKESSGEEPAKGEERGFYIHDLGSTHGTFVNKNKIPPKTFIRLRVGHVIKFGGSTRLFILQGPEFDEEAASELTVTELRERSRKQREELEKRMMGEVSDEDDDDENEKEAEGQSGTCQGKKSKDDSGCSWGMAEEAAPDDESEENPFATEFQEDQEAAYLKDPKKALQGFYEREGEELEFEYEDKNHSTWLCRIKLPVDDAMGRQLVAEVTHTGKKKDAAIQCCLEACRILEARGLLRQEAVSRKRKKKDWENEDFYDSDDDTFLDRTGAVEKKRQERMKKAGKIEERPDTYDSLVVKLAEVEKQITETQSKLNSSSRGSSNSSADDPLDAFMSVVQNEAALDNVERRKLHVHMADLRKEAHRLRRLVELTRPAQMPSLQSGVGIGSSDLQKPKKSLPLFGAMKGGSKFKLKTGTIGMLPPKRPSLPAELFNMKELPSGEEEEEEEEDEEEEEEEPKEGAGEEPGAKPSPKKSIKKKMIGPSKRPATLSGQYPEDDPDYCVWLPPTGQSGDGRTHLNEKYGY